MAQTDESTTGQPLVQFEEIDTDEILDGLDFEGDEETDGPTDDATTPTPEGDAANGAEEVPASPGSDVGSAAETQPAGEEPASGTEASTAPDQDHPNTEGTPSVRPFTINVDRQTIAPEGAYIVPPAGEGDKARIVIDEDVWNRQIVPHLAHRGTFQRELRARDLEIAELKEARGSKEQQAEVLLQHLNELYGDPDKLTTFLANFDRDAPEMRAKAENARLAAELEETKRGKLTPAQRIEQEEQEARDLANGLAEWVQTIANPQELLRELSGRIDPEEAKQIAAEFTGVKLDLTGVYRTLMQPELRGAVFVTADADDPEAGLKKGDRAVNVGTVLSLMRREAALARRYGTQTTQAVTQAKDNGAKVGGGPRKVHPATGTATGSPAVTPGAKAEPKNREEWVRSLEEDD